MGLLNIHVGRCFLLLLSVDSGIDLCVVDLALCVVALVSLEQEADASKMHYYCPPLALRSSCLVVVILDLVDACMCLRI